MLFSNSAIWGRHRQLDDSLVGQLTTQKENQLIMLLTHFVGQVPARLRKLEPVNAVLAHRPSALSAAHIKVYSHLHLRLTIQQ